jgi:hypothetical protein
LVPHILEALTKPRKTSIYLVFCKSSKNTGFDSVQG